MNSQEVIEELIKLGLVVKTGNDSYVVSNSAKRKATQDTKPEEVTVTPRALLEKFIKDSRIPYIIKISGGGRFTPGSISDYAVKYFAKVREEYNYDDMVMATNLYYNNPKIARVSLTKYFKEGIFTHTMVDYLENGKSKMPAEQLRELENRSSTKINSISL